MPAPRRGLRGGLRLSLAVGVSILAAAYLLLYFRNYLLGGGAEKMVMAHYMPGMLPFRGGEDLWLNPKYYDPQGPTSNLGGAMLTIPTPALLHRSDRYPVDLEADEAILLEIRTAKYFGVDAFEFYYPWDGTGETMRRYNEIIARFFKVANREGIRDFYFTIAVSHPIAGGRDEKILGISRAIRELMYMVGAENPNWLRTRDGRILLSTWLPDSLEYAEEFWKVPETPELVGRVAAAFSELADRAGVKAEWIYTVHSVPRDRGLAQRYADEITRSFRAVRGWATSACLDQGFWDYLADQAHRRGALYVQEVMGDFFTGKLYRGEPPDGLVYNPDELTGLKPGEVKRWGMVLNLTHNFRAQLENAIRRRADMISVTSWNDYPEGTHVAPEINHNFGFALLLKYYAALWRGRPEDAPADVVIIAFKKYPSNATPAPFNIGARIDNVCGPPQVEDFIEVVAILGGPSEVVVNNRVSFQAGPGLSVHRTPAEPGHVNVKVLRGGVVVIDVTTPEAITLSPFRTDRLTYTFTSNFREVYRDLYGEAPLFSSNQYAVVKLVDGP